ncbi:MAG: hypothetical protein DRI34_11025 [Deltaproteobacteria bacterium]|nr:MAG: hypothetical protein DRI34_11025 [Deltaproteobacteria bacterium]
MSERGKIDRKIRRARRGQTITCPCCGQEVKFCWSCPCGFHVCQSCMDENAWGLTCNGVTWTCPDCGRQRSY